MLFFIFVIIKNPLPIIIWIIVIVGGAALLSMGLRKLHKGLI